MFTKKVHRNKFYSFIYEHLTDNGIALIITMGDGINSYKSNTKDAFKKVNRININTGKQMKVAMTSCFIVDTNTFTKEINDNNLEIIKTWISEDIPNFDKCICTLVKKNYLLKIINNSDILNNSIKYIKVNRGFTNTIYTLDNKYIVKICSNKDNKERFNNEINFYLSNKNNKYIPRLYDYYISNNKDYSYEIIELIKGKTLYSVWHTLNTKERKYIIKEITNIMKSIHSIKGNYYDFSKYLKDKLNTNYNKVKDMFNDKEIELYNKIINNINKYFKDKDLRLIHNDIHFDNILIDTNNNIKIIDFERSIIAPIDYELDIFLRMCNNPTKYASEEDTKYIDINDYKDIPIYLKEYYPEIYNFNYFDIRHLIYDLEANLRLLPRFKDNIELKDKVIEIIYKLDKEMENN